MPESFSKALDDAEPLDVLGAAIRDEAEAAGVPTDVQGLLVNGDPAKGIPRDIVGLILGVAKSGASDGT